MYQDIPLYSLEEFVQVAPEEARTDEVLANDHQLMLNRLSFELFERQRSVRYPLSPCYIFSSCGHCRLDQRHKELLKEKEDLLKESKAKLTTLDTVKGQIDSLIKVRRRIILFCPVLTRDFCRLPQTCRRRWRNSPQPQLRHEVSAVVAPLKHPYTPTTPRL